MGITGLVLRERMRYESTYASLQGYLAPPAGANIAASSLTPQQARDMVLHYWVNKLISLEEIPTCDAKGNVLTPKMGGKVRVRLENIAGVKFIADQKIARTWIHTKQIHMRTVALIVRFAQFLKREWNASVIYWGGLGAGRVAGDMHVDGWALDFHGAETPSGNFDVHRDWGLKTVATSIGGLDGRWPATATKTKYRLAADPLDMSRLVLGMVTRKFFEDCYRFGTDQANNRNGLTVHYIGEQSSVLHPDTPFPKLRDGHQDHMHFDVI
jgi:hypothetical protein